MRKTLIGFVVAAVAALLSGCFVAETSFIPPEEAAYPFDRIVYAQTGGQPITLTREGDDYIAVSDNERLRLRFLDLGDNFYVVQMGGTEPGDDSWLLGLIKVDLGARTAFGYKLVGSEADVGPGRTLCDGNICVETLDVYVEYARAAADAGARADAVYTIVSTE